MKKFAKVDNDNEAHVCNGTEASRGARRAENSGPASAPLGSNEGVKLRQAASILRLTHP